MDYKIDLLEYKRSHEFQIYILDCDYASSVSPDGDEYPHIKPTYRLKWDYPSSLAFCALDSYMFDGHDERRTCVRTRDPDERRNAAKFETNPQTLPESDCKLGEDNLVALKSMNHVKVFPAALPTPDGESILVYSLRIDDDSDIPNTFELYNVASDSWKLLPPLPHSVEGFGYVSIRSYWV